MNSQSKVMTLVVALAIGVGCVVSATAQTRALQGHVPAIVSQLTPIGRLPGTTNLHLAISLPLHNQTALASFLRQLYDPTSTNYKHYLTPEQFTAQFGPTEQEYLAVIDFAQANGLVVTGTSPNRMLLEVSGSVADIENAFQVAMQVYPHPTEPRTFFAPNVEPSVPESVPILDIGGINNYNIPRPNLAPTPAGRPVPSSGSAPDSSGEYFGKDFRAAYVPGVSLTGSGQKVALVEFDGYYPSDIQEYIYYAGLQGFSITATTNTILLSGFNGVPGGNNSEVALDIEMAMAMAPNLSVVNVYEAPNNSASPNVILNQIATDDSANQISCSWNGFSRLSSTESILEEFEAQGQSYFNCSADHDAYIGDFAVYPADSTNVISVGGTTLTTTGPGGAWVSETVWNWDVEYGSGYNEVGSSGGTSTSVGIPYWQQGISMANNQGSTTMRNFPDVALTADNIFLIFNDGEFQNEGGTSCATPLWAGFCALVNQQAAAEGHASVGFLNPALYSMGMGTTYDFCFHDITTGNNEWSSSPTMYSGVTGYDLCTGWGTPNGIDLIDSFQSGSNLFESTGSMAVGREGHTATLLTNGMVLVAAGSGTYGYTNKAELYNPATGTWGSTGTLPVSMAGHTATLLTNGEVLVAGGANSISDLSSAELYNPVAGTWSSTANSMTTARQGATATLLTNGLVLVAGGSSLFTMSGVTATSDLYNPVTGMWASAPAAGNMKAARTGHTATLLPNGTVLITGGENTNGVLSSVEFFNPTVPFYLAFQFTNSMSTPRYGATATLLPNGMVLVAGGQNSSGVLSSAETYNPATGTWAATGNNMTTARWGQTATLLPNGLVLLTGGDNSSGPLATAELYNPVANTWATTAISMTTKRLDGTATLLPNGTVLIAGGTGTTLPIIRNSAELYVP